MTGRVFHVGTHPGVATALAEAFGVPPVSGPVRGLAAGDTIVAEAFSDLSTREDVAGRNAFSACKVWKGQRGVVVHLVVLADDPLGVQLACFALADGVLRLRPDGRIDGLEQLQPASPRRPARTIEALLERYGGAMASGPRNSQVLQRLLQWERSDSFLHRLQDAETGLLDGPYTALKLDEEWKRSQRFHLPLSLVLLDISGAADVPAGPDRRALLAEVAAVFLNECRDIDVLGRFTATTFLFLLPGTPGDGARVLAQRLLTTLRERRFAVPLVPIAGLVAVPMSGIADRKGFLLVAEACLERARTGQGVGGLVTAWE